MHASISVRRACPNEAKRRARLHSLSIDMALGLVRAAFAGKNGNSEGRVRPGRPMGLGRGEMRTPLLRTPRMPPAKLYTPLAEVAHAVPYSTYMFCK